MSGRLPDPGMGAICGRCGEPREAHGGPRHLGACPGESGIKAKRFSIEPGDRPNPAWEPPERLPLPPPAPTGMDDLITWLRAVWDEDEGIMVDLDRQGERAYPTYPERIEEIDAKRRILDDCVQADRHGDLGAVNLAESVVYALAQPYAGRDGWRQEWTADV